MADGHDKMTKKLPQSCLQKKKKKSTNVFFPQMDYSFCFLLYVPLFNFYKELFFINIIIQRSMNDSYHIK